MTTQYGFLSIPAAVLAVKPANWRAKILKILARKSVSAVFMNMLAATGRKIMASGIRMSLPTISQFRATTAMIRRVPKSAPAAQCTNEKMALWWSMKMFVSAAATATWLVRTARHSTMLKRAHDEVRWLLFARRRGKQPICVESCPLRALEFGPIEELRQKHGTLAAVAPLPRAHFTKPNIVIKPNANSRPTGDTTGYLANPEEV